MLKAIPATPFAHVNEILTVLYTRVRDNLDEQLIGMYLHGSLANGGFDEYSDIDVVFVTREDISDGDFAALAAMHREISQIDSPWAVQLEVSYIPKNALRRFDRSDMTHPHLDRGNGEVLHRMAHECDWIIQRHTLRERGIVVVGPDPKTLMDPVSGDDLRKAVVEGMPLWFSPVIKNPSELNTRGYQSFFVLSICRMLYTLKHGEILSKRAAAQWASEALDSRWKPIIQRALAGRQAPDLAPVPGDVGWTLDMMRYALRHVRPTAYPEVNEVLALLLTRVKEIIGEHFVGLYLYGSLSSGDFDPVASDIDFLVVTVCLLSEDKIAELETMHAEIWSTGSTWAGKLEGAYVPGELIRRHNPDGAPCPTVNEGRFYLARLGSDWIIQRHVVRESGLVLTGPDPKTLIDRVTPDDIRGAVRSILEEWWFPKLEDPEWLANRGAQYQAFAILTLCRALYALEHGTIVSKVAAARWAQETLGKPWSTVIERSILAQKPGAGQTSLLTDALELIRYAQENLEV